MPTCAICGRHVKYRTLDFDDTALLKGSWESGPLTERPINFQARNAKKQIPNFLSTTHTEVTIGFQRLAQHR